MDKKLDPKYKLRPFCSHYEYYCTATVFSPISKPLGQWKGKGCSTGGGSTAIAWGGEAVEWYVLYVCVGERGQGRRAVRAKRDKAFHCFPSDYTVFADVGDKKSSRKACLDRPGSHWR